MKRFWDNASAAPVEGGFRVLLDGRPVRLPGGGHLRVDTIALADALAAEWQAAGGSKGNEMSPEDVPLTRLVGTAQDRIAPDPSAMVDGLAKYGETDLLCYRAEDYKLAERQAQQWQPLLDWAALHLDAPLRSTDGLMPVAQDAGALAALNRAVAAANPLQLAALGLLVPALGSLVLGLAVLHGRLDGAEAYRLATLDETFQEEFWGTDAESEQRRARGAADVALATRLLSLAGG